LRGVAYLRHLLSLFVLFSAVLSLWALGKENAIQLGLTAKLFSFELVPLEDALNLLLTSLGLSVSIRAYATNFQPYLVYEIFEHQDSALGLKLEKVVRLTLRNSGTGLAHLVKICCLNTQKLITSEGVEAIAKALAQLGQDRINWYLIKPSAGYVLAPSQTLVVLEYAAELAAALNHLELQITYQDMLGRRFTKAIHPYIRT
jgi:hypothetical protein